MQNLNSLDWNSQTKRSGRFSRFLYTLLTERSSPARLGVAVGVGIFSGTLPFLGIQSFIAVFLATVFKLNRLVTLTASWIATPILAPLLYFFSIETGEYLLHGAFIPLSIEEVKGMTISSFFASWLIGSLIIGTAAGLLSFIITYKGISLFRKKGESAPNLLNM